MVVARVKVGVTKMVVSSVVVLVQPQSSLANAELTAVCSRLSEAIVVTWGTSTARWMISVVEGTWVAVMG